MLCKRQTVPSIRSTNWAGNVLLLTQKTDRRLIGIIAADDVLIERFPRRMTYKLQEFQLSLNYGRKFLDMIIET